MCKSSSKRADLRKLDLFGQPVGVTFNGEYKHRTALGGFVTVFLLIFFGGNMVLSVVNAIVHPEFTSKSTLSYVHYADDNIEAFDMSTNN